MDPIQYYIEEDLGRGDATTRALWIGQKSVRATIVVNEPCVLAGGEEAIEVFHRMGAEASPIEKDGVDVVAGSTIMNITGTAEGVLAAERLVLNMLSRMSGIATATRDLTDKVQAINPNVRIAATRKTTPGFRVFEKKAVVLGGGDPHRQRLDDLVLIKDNHLSLINSIGDAVRLARENTNLSIEVEVESVEQALEAVDAGAEIIMLDNMNPVEAERCFKGIKERSPNIMVEVSGGITPENAPSYALCADRISMSRITSYSKPIDFTLHFNGE